MGLAAGPLRHQVQLQRKAQAQDPSSGAITESWQTYARVWVSIAPASAREFQAAAAAQSEVRGKFIARYRSDTDATHAVLHRGKRYQILGVLPDNDSGLEWMTLPFAEGVAVVP